ncbi:phage tail domain-containing protein [Streptomyces sp. NBC_00572]|uniref:phage distal tail protein n=1 Tax=Streptomyces sp. NBC_00572 TaxID=2903664 RepID=UPI00224CA0F7|nr:phage tail domain-containing protein [Streptomyces sp. NBC_00572]MCX4982809.1 phage tail family protein [Streptomyces sp. NBC_00572]
MAETTTPYAGSNFTADLAPGSLITQDGQMQWAGLLIGPGTPFAVDKSGLSGWEDLPEYDSSDADRPTSHGAWPGSRYAKPRKVGGTIVLMPEWNQATEAVRALRQSLALLDEERWLTVRLHGEMLAVRARIAQRVVPADQGFATQGSSRMSIQWLASDPRRYVVNEQLATATAPQPESGLTWPLIWPLSWGQAKSTGDAVVENIGSAPAHPVIVFRGPCSMPTVTERTSRRRLRYGIDLAAGDELVIDTRAGTVLLNNSASRLHTAMADSSPEELFVLDPGRTELSFRPDEATEDALMTVRWRSAEW